MVKGEIEQPALTKEKNKENLGYHMIHTVEELDRIQLNQR